MHTRLERVRATSGTRRGRCETVKPVFIKDNVSSSIELIAAAHTALPHVDAPSGPVGPSGHALRGGM